MVIILSEKYVNLLEALDNFINMFVEYCDELDDGYPLVTVMNRWGVRMVLLDLWLGVKEDSGVIVQSTTGSKEKTVTGLYGNSITDFISRIELFKKIKYHFQWINGEPPHWANSLVARRFGDTVEDFFYKLDKLPNRVINQNLEILREGLLNVFFRLTDHSSEAIVPLRDLIDRETADILFSSIGEPHDRFLKWKLLIEGIFFSLHVMGVQLPAPYYPKLAALERKDELNEEILKLEASFVEWDKRGRKG